MKKGFKGFEKDFTCRGKQYTPGEISEEKGDVEVCGNGLHYCDMPLDVFEFYPPNGKNVYADIEDLGNTKKEETKSCTNKLKVGAKLSIANLFKAHFEIINEKVETSEKTITTAGDESHANTAGDESHANTKGSNAIACSLGIQSKSMAEKGWIVIVDWQYSYGAWAIKSIESAQVGGQIKGLEIQPNVWYWFENGVLKSENC